jgi:predicted dehydrogenase
MSSAIESLGFAIVGCGNVGRKRAATVVGARLVICADTNPGNAHNLAERLREQGVEASNTTWDDAVSDPEIDVVVVSTTHDALSPIACAALQEGKHVLVEKPAGCSSADIDAILLSQKDQYVRVGFNHRYHPAILRAASMVRADALGEIMMVRGRYGHGGRLGYEKEWRGDPARGGGELLDQGVHLIDLAGLFLGHPFEEVTGRAETLFWDQKVDDNAFMILRSSTGQIAHLHVSSTEWKNTFSFEIYGTAGKLHIEGLGGSYGVERLTYYAMAPEMGPPETTIWDFHQADASWQLEMDEFVRDIVYKQVPNVGLLEAKAAMEVVEQIKALSTSPVAYLARLG